MEKKKIGTLTFHIAHNYGAMLQAYALPKAVQSLGYDCEIIHYCFSYIYPWGHIERLNELCQKYGLVGGSLRYVKRFCKGVYNPKLKVNKFESFIYKTMPLSERTYKSREELTLLDYDAIVFGSDQIWNSKLTDGIAPEFVGGFPCQSKTKKIAYAASCGRSHFLAEEKECYYPLLKDFKALGIRENGFCQSLCEDGFVATNVLDPTLLLNRADWDEMANGISSDITIPQNKYLLVYVFDENDSVYDFVDAVAEKYNLEVHVIAYEAKPQTEKYKVHTNCGPADFVRLISGASAVVTTSFHGTAFSIIYGKDLYCVPHPTLHERTDSLLSMLGMDERNCNYEVDLDMIQPIDWQAVNQRLDNARQVSLAFLKRTLE